MSLKEDHGHCHSVSNAEDQPWAKKWEKSLRTLPEEPGLGYGRPLRGGGCWYCRLSSCGVGTGQGYALEGIACFSVEAWQDPHAGRALTIRLGKDCGRGFGPCISTTRGSPVVITVAPWLLQTWTQWPAPSWSHKQNGPRLLLGQDDTDYSGLSVPAEPGRPGATMG